MRLNEKEFDPIPFKNYIIKLSPVFIASLWLYAIFYHPNTYTAWIMPASYIIVAILMKSAAPRIPITQLIFALGLAFGISAISPYLTNYVSPIVLFLFVEKLLIPFILIFGFGKYWVSKRYMPSRSNF